MRVSAAQYVHLLILRYAGRLHKFFSIVLRERGRETGRERERKELK